MPKSLPFSSSFVDYTWFLRPKTVRIFSDAKTSLFDRTWCTFVLLAGRLRQVAFYLHELARPKQVVFHRRHMANALRNFRLSPSRFSPLPPTGPARRQVIYFVLVSYLYFTFRQLAIDKTKHYRRSILDSNEK